jgi:hypothetical protein
MSEAIGTLADRLYQLQQDKGRITAQVRELDREIAEVEEELFKEMDRQKTTVCRGQFATITLGENEVPQVEDWPRFHAFLLKHKLMGLLQRRVSVEAWREEMERRKGGIPGVTSYTKRTLSVRKV